MNRFIGSLDGLNAVKGMVMRILFLYNNDGALPLAKWLQEQGETVDFCTEKLTDKNLPIQTYDLAISYSYSYILSQAVIDHFHGNIINLHISYLPFNRGGNPNPWSFLEGTPQGVTIHYVSSALDKGNVIAQSLLHMQIETETLRSSYDTLNEAIQELFKTIYPYYSHWEEMQKKSQGKGTYHKTADFLKYRALISSWDMPIQLFLEKAKRLNENL